MMPKATTEMERSYETAKANRAKVENAVRAAERITTSHPPKLEASHQGVGDEPLTEAEQAYLDDAVADAKKQAEGIIAQLPTDIDLYRDTAIAMIEAVERGTIPVDQAKEIILKSVEAAYHTKPTRE